MKEGELSPPSLSLSLSGMRPRPLIVISQRQVINWHAIYGGVSRHLIEMRGRTDDGGLSDPITPSLLVSLFLIFFWRGLNGEIFTSKFRVLV